MRAPWSQPTVLPTSVSAPPKSQCAHQHPAHANLHIRFHTVCSRIKTCWHTSSDRASERSVSAHTRLTFFFFAGRERFSIPWSLPHFLIMYRLRSTFLFCFNITRSRLPLTFLLACYLSFTNVLNHLHWLRFIVFSSLHPRVLIPLHI